MENQFTSNRLSAAPQFSPAPQIFNYGPVRELIEQDGYRACLECDIEDSFPIVDAYALIVEEPWPPAESLAQTGNTRPLAENGRNPTRRNRLVQRTPKDVSLEIFSAAVVRQ